MQKIVFHLIAILAFSFVAHAQVPCALDYSFASGGKLVSTGGREAYRLAIQSDGKIIVGCEPSSSTGNLIIRRLNTDGSTDLSFGNNGNVSLTIGEKATRVKDIKIYNDVIYIAGTTSTDIGGTTTYVYFAALTANGQFLNSFGTNGIKTFNSTPKLYTVGAMAISENGEIYAVGSKTSSSYYALKLSASTGNLISGFDGDGLLDIVAPTNYRYELQDIKVDHNGKIIIAGSSYKWINNVTTEYYKLLMRMDQNAVWDNSFGMNGRNTFYKDPVITQRGYKVLINKANEYFITGYTYAQGDFDYSIVKVKNDGQEDVSFGTNGWQVYDLNGNKVLDASYNAVMMPDEKMLLSGVHGSGDTVHFSMLMTHPSGTRDVSFAPNGYFTTIFNQNNNSASNGLALDPTGKIVLGGYTRTCTGGTCGPLYMAIARFTFSIGAPLSIQAVSLLHQEFYPNPIKAGMFLHVNSLTWKDKIELFSLMGAKIKNLSINQSNTIEIPQQIIPGVYVLKIKNETGIVYQKLIIE